MKQTLLCKYHNSQIFINESLPRIKSSEKNLMEKGLDFVRWIERKGLLGVLLDDFILANISSSNTRACLPSRSFLNFDRSKIRDLSRDDWIKEFIKRKWSSGLVWAVGAAEKKTLPNALRPQLLSTISFSPPSIFSRNMAKVFLFENTIYVPIRPPRYTSTVVVKGSQNT